MGRPRKQSREPFWFEARKAWYVTVGSRKRRLSPDKDEAWRLWHELMARLPSEPEEPALPGPDATALEIVDAFLEWTSKNRDPLTYEAYRRRLQAFAGSIPPTLRLADLKPHHVARTLDAHLDWSNNTKHDVATAAQRAFNWAEKQGLIARNPIRLVEKPGRESRELAVSPDDFAEVMAAIEEPNFRMLLEFAWESGVRPQEIVKIEARHILPDLKRVVLPPKEAKGKKRHRVIYLTEAGFEMIRPLAEQRPEGALFRNSGGAAWNKDSINCAFCRLRVKLAERMMDREGHPRPVVAKVPRPMLSRARAERREKAALWKAERARYVRERVPKFHMGAWRKGYATEAIKAGVDLSTLSSLMGHQDGRMLTTVYSKVYQDHRHMADAAEKAKKPRD